MNSYRTNQSFINITGIQNLINNFAIFVANWMFCHVQMILCDYTEMLFCSQTTEIFNWKPIHITYLSRTYHHLWNGARSPDQIIQLNIAETKMALADNIISELHNTSTGWHLSVLMKNQPHHRIWVPVFRNIKMQPFYTSM